VPDAERCRKASREGTSRVFEAIAGDKPGSLPGKGYYLADPLERILSF